MSTYKTRANIFIGGIKINKYKNIKVERSIDGNKATIIYPDNLLIGEKYLYRTGSDKNPLASGQYIYIDMGWDKLLSDEFTTKQKNTYFDAITPEGDDSRKPKFIGFISKVTQNIKNRELVVECEDYNYLLKRIKFDFSEKSISLKDLGQKLIDKLPKLDVSMNITDDDFIFVEFKNYASVTTGLEFTLKKYVAEKATGYDILKHLSDDFNIKSVWDGNTLIIGVNYLNSNTGSEKEFRFTQVPRRKQTTDMLYVLDTSGLTWQNSKDVSYKITANLVDTSLEVKQLELGDIEGQEREFWFYGYKKADEKQVKALVENELSRLKYDGFKEGSKIKTFGQMSLDFKRGVNPLDTIILDGIDYRTELDGKKTVLPTTSYLCNSIIYTMDGNGFMAEIELGQFFPVEVDSFYEVDSSFNTSNLEVSAKVIKFSGEETFNTATGTTTVVREPEPVVKVEEPVVEDTLVRDLKNLIQQYKSILSQFKEATTLQTTLLSDLGYNGGSGYWTKVDLSFKFIDLVTVNYFNIIYRGRERETLGQPIDGYNYNPPNLQGMRITDVKNLVGGDASFMGIFNNNVGAISDILDELNEMWKDMMSFKQKATSEDLSKLTDDEKYIFDEVTEYGKTNRIVSILSIV